MVPPPGGRRSTIGRAQSGEYDRSCYVVNMPGPRKPRADGERTREAIVREAVSLATVDGLEGLSIGNLAARLGMSKSGVYAHFGSKQELQLAAVRRGRADLPRRGRRTGPGRHAGARSARRGLRRLLRPPRGPDVPGRLLLRRRRPRDGHASRSGQGGARRLPEQFHRADPPVRGRCARAARAPRATRTPTRSPSS